MSRTLIRGGCILTLGSRTPNFPEADVLIENDIIQEVGPGLRAKDAEVIDASNAIVMPGFVDTHRHTCMSLFRNLGANAADIDASAFQPDDVYAATLIGLLGAIEAGITTVVDWAAIPDEEGFTEAAMQAHADAGLRTVFVRVAGGGSPVGVAATHARGEGGPLTAMAFGSVDLTTADIDRIHRDWAVARQQGRRIHAHAGLLNADSGVVAGLGRDGLLGPDVTLVHCSRLGDDDLDAIAAAGASVAVAPSAEMASGLGAPPLQKFLDRRILPGLAVDDERVAPGDMFAQMRVTNSIQHAAYFDLKLAGKAGLPNLLTTRDVIRYATVEGARAVGLADVTGSLDPGKQADVVVLRTDRPNIYPINDPIGAIVWGVDSSNLETVLVAGRPLMRNGVLEADTGRARSLALAARDRVMAAFGQLAEVDRGGMP